MPGTLHPILSGGIIWVMVVSFMFILSPTKGAGEDIYVSPNGDDAWSGGLPEPNAEGTDGPFRTLGRAGEAAGPGDTCYIRGGVYRETLKPARSGAPGSPITFTNYRDEVAIISGADAVTGWRRIDGEIYGAEMEWNLGHENQVFADGKMLTEARWPDNTAGTLLQPVRATVKSGTKDTITDPDLPGEDNAWKGALLWCAGGSRWICWTGRVTGFDAGTKTLTFDPPRENKWYQPRAGNEYVLMGLRSALDAPGEWWYDADNARLLLVGPEEKDPDALVIEAKRRMYAIDLAGRSHINMRGLQFRGGGLRTDGESSHIVLERLKGEYVGHSYERDISGHGSVLIHGSNIIVRHCEFAYGSGSVLHLKGSDNTVHNCYIHDGDYGGKWQGVMVADGRRQVISHNTIQHSGRVTLSVGHSLSESIIERNDLCDAGWLTSDLGLTYGHNNDFQNTVLRYNLAHDNRAEDCSMGIYFDHLSHNVIIHDNVVWNVDRDPVRLNNPSYFNLVFNNTAYNTGRISTFDHSHRQDLFGCRFYNNIFNEAMGLPDHVHIKGNIIASQPGLIDPEAMEFGLKEDAAARDAAIPIPGITDGFSGGSPDAGALEYGEQLWKAGHDFEAPPPEPEWEPVEVAYMDGVKNACFEYGTLESWTKTGEGNAEIVAGNGWGNDWGGPGQPAATGTSKHELRLGGGRDGVRQQVEGLHPDTEYELSAWLRVSDEDELVSLAVAGAGGEKQAVSTNSTNWTRKIVRFTTGPGQETITIHLMKTSDGAGHAFCDNVGLPLVPAGAG